MEFFQVYNIIPSISSITGIRPQIYLWRSIIALHLTPRLVIAYVHKNFLKHHVLCKIQDQIQYAKASRLATAVHYLNMIEIASLAGVTYVSNKENYRKSCYTACLLHAHALMLFIFSFSFQQFTRKSSSRLW
jgi:hypothetical protein